LPKPLAQPSKRVRTTRCGRLVLMSQPTFESTEAVPATATDRREQAAHTWNRTRVRIRHDLFACALLTALWIAPVFVVGLHGEFPLNDDWAYAKSVQKFIETGQMSREEWTHIPIVTHTLIGRVFVELFGDSLQFFQSLRLVGFFMGWAGIMGTYVLCRQVGAGLNWSAFAALLFGFNPIYFNLSYTYMTDVPFAAMFVWSVALVTRGFVTGRLWWFGAGLLFAILATLIRQFGLAIPVGFAAALVITRPMNPWRWLMAIALPVGVLLAYFGVTWLVYEDSQAITGNAYLFHHVTVKVQDRLPLLLLKGGTYHWLCLGFCLGPLGWLLARACVWTRFRFILLTSGLTLLITAVMLWKGWHLPAHNIIHNLGLGAKETIPGFMTLPQLPIWIWWLISLLSAVSASCLVLLMLNYVFMNWPASRRNHVLMLLFGTIAAYSTIVVRGHFDRYILPVLPVVTALLAYPVLAMRKPRNRGVGGAIVIMLLFATFSIAGTRDYVERNRNLWALLSTLMNEAEINPEHIHGGFEFNRWHGFQRYNHVFSEELGVFLWVFDDKDEYVVSYASEVEGYTRTERQIVYRRWLPPGSEQISVFRRNPIASVRADSTTDAMP